MTLLVIGDWRSVLERAVAPLFKGIWNSLDASRTLGTMFESQYFLAGSFGHCSSAHSHLPAGSQEQSSSKLKTCRERNTAQPVAILTLSVFVEVKGRRTSGLRYLLR
jgi:hypothetical protein